MRAVLVRGSRNYEVEEIKITHTHTYTLSQWVK